MRAARRHRRVENIPLSVEESMLHRLRPITRLSLSAVLLGWLLLQMLLPILGQDPAMIEVGRTLTKLLVVAIPVCVGLLRAFFPDADVSPKKLETLLMVASLGFATTFVLRRLLKTLPLAGDSIGQAATA
jgi:hypothetical protein